ncbi:hypothetical protein [Granulicella arctica]|uniref:hypothetical protein n=1 Tax=Granulicella arctica TaxID=940613 RepID=UPI0021E0AA31|nr:hypothetical protein [Granulicella arctica]
MGKEWIEQLAGDLKEKGRDAAESYGREQHRAGIIDAEGKVFFLAAVAAIEQDFTEIRSQLQGSPISCETSIVRTGPAEVKLTRSRFPWFDATLKHNDADVTLDYARGRGVAPDKVIEDTTEHTLAHYSFQVDPQDKMTLGESFGDAPKSFETADEFSKHIVELLFKV